MVVTIEQIREGGLQLNEPVSTDFLDSALTSEGRDTGFRAGGAAELSATLRKVSGGVLLTGRLEIPVTAPCKRCVTEVQLRIPVSFTLNLVPEKLVRSEEEDRDESEEGESEGSFQLENADQELFDGKTIDLDPIIREQVLLALPMNAVCREDCKGLCPSCGQNLNEKTCACEPRVVDPRLAVLKDIKLN